MGRLVDLTTLRAEVRSRTDTENETTRFTVAEVDRYINSGIAQYHQELVIAGGQGFSVADTFFTTVPGTQYYALPADWLTIKKVWTTVDNEECVLDSYAEPETNGLIEPTGYPQVMRYRIEGDNISLRPVPSAANQVINVKYTTTSTDLLAPADNVDGFSGLEEYIICWAAKQIAIKQRDDLLVSLLDGQRGEVLRRLLALQRARNSDDPPRMIYRRPIATANRRAFRWRGRYP